MTAIVTIILIILGIAISIALHELGHLIPAKIFHVPVTEYFIGFGPTLFAKKVGETLCGVKLIWLGGYTKIVGMFPNKNIGIKHSKLGIAWDKRFENIITSARQESLDEVTSDIEPRAFYNLTCGKKIVVMLGGILTNLFLGFLCFVLAFTVIGGSQPVPTVEKMSAVTGTVEPAKEAGLEVGDKIIKINDTQIDNWQKLLDTVNGLKSPDAKIVYERNGEEKETTIHAEKDMNGAYKFGIQAATEPIHATLGESAAITLSTTLMTAAAIVTIPVQLFNTIKTLLTGGERSSSLVSIVGLGEVAVASTTQGESTPAQKFAGIVSLIGSLNIALFIFNLIPLLPFDGGQAVNAIYEGLKRGIAKIRKKPRPAPSDLARSMPVSYFVWGILIIMSIILILADIVNPIV
ncbi:MAG: M50 family metallopeptidase [Candidatus Ancillula sp.]|jgi:membrane-associated protease RseP (regulator of RpoE activity)|nr:M50 family metallopeptidase [Candidatus Ancillula sp.]